MRMKRKIVCLLFSYALCLLLYGTSSSEPSRNAKNAREFLEALQSGASEITVTASFRGNFTIPRWVSSISGIGGNITIAPSDMTRPVLETESTPLWQVSFLTSASDSLKISGLTIISPGVSGAVDASSLTKPLTLSGVKIIGAYNGAFGCRPGISTVFTACVFENLDAGVYASSSSAKYDINIHGCTFRRVSQALAMDRTNPNAEASIEKCRGHRLGWWVSQHGMGDDTMYVTVDQATVDSYKGSDYYHKAVEALENGNAYTSNELRGFLKDLEERFSALPEGAKRLITREKSRGWDGVRVYSMIEISRKLRAIDFSGKDMSAADECAGLYALLASAPVAGIFGNDGNIDRSQLFALYEETMSGMVNDKNLVRPLIWGFTSDAELGQLTRTGARISWGESGNVRRALGKISQNPDRIFRKNLHRLTDWLMALDETRKNLEEVSREARGSCDYSYVLNLENTLRNIHDFGVAVNIVAKAVYFDLPIDVSFAVNFARVTEEAGSPSRNMPKIAGICRELGSFYNVSQNLCVLRRTQTLRDELVKTWKNALTENNIWGSSTNRYDELMNSLSVDPDIMRDAVRVSDFLREWR